MSTLAAILDQIIPPSPDGRMPGAGALGLADAIEEAIAGTGGRDWLADNLAAIEAAAQDAHGTSFGELAAQDAEALLRTVDEARPGLVQGMLFPLYIAYYQHPDVARALGHEGRPPHPQGYPLEKGDLSLLDPVRARAPLYRQV